MQGFKKFLLQGNVVELAVAVIIAGAFGKVVDAVVKFLMDIIALVGGAPSFDSLSLAIGDNQLYYGPVITAVVGFVILAAVIYFMIVKPYETARAHLAPLLASRPIGLTLQVDEGPEVFDGKFGNLHPLFQKKD